MARTKADAGKKAGGKASRKAPVLRTTSTPKSSGVSKGSKRKGSGGGRNSAVKRAVPKWQMPISEFLAKAGSSKEAAAGAPSKEQEIDMAITEDAPTISAACGSADSTVKEAEDLGDEVADTSITEGEATNNSVEEDEAAKTSVDEDETSDNSIVEDEVAEKSMNRDKATEDNDEEVKIESSKNGQENGEILKKEDGEVSVMDENSSDIEVVYEIAPKKENDVTIIMEIKHEKRKSSDSD